MLVSKADHERIAEAVAKAESSANGEIVCVLARRSSDYRETPLVWACAAALVLQAAPIGWRGGLLALAVAVSVILWRRWSRRLS